MSLQSRREYLAIAQRRYRDAKTKNEKSRIIYEVLENLSYHRKYAIQVLNHLLPERRQKIRRPRKPKYLEALARHSGCLGGSGLLLRGAAASRTPISSREPGASWGDCSYSPDQGPAHL
jgi:hypothetical protein